MAGHRTGKSNSFSGYGSGLSVKCHHSREYPLKPNFDIAEVNNCLFARASGLRPWTSDELFELKQSKLVPKSRDVSSGLVVNGPSHAPAALGVDNGASDERIIPTSTVDPLE